MMLRLFLLIKLLLIGSLKCDPFDVYSDLGFEDPITNLISTKSFHQNFFNSIPQRCTTPSNSGRVGGVCRNYLECRFLGGTANYQAECSPFQRCCYHSKSCDESTKTRVSVFTQAKYSEISTTPEEEQSVIGIGENVENGGNCKYTAEIVNGNICQVRVEFNTELAPPNSAGMCKDDYVDIIGGVVQAGTTRPRICGKNDNQHIYLNVDNKTRSIEIEVVLVKRDSTSQLSSPKWTIQVIQLECPGRYSRFTTKSGMTQAGLDFHLLAPQGCLQYHPFSSGIIKSFNYGSGDFAYPPNTNYAICFRHSLYSCGIHVSLGNFTLHNSSALSLLGGVPITKGDPVTTVSNGALGYSTELNRNEITAKSSEWESKIPGPYFLSFHSDTAVGEGFNIKYNTITQC